MAQLLMMCRLLRIQMVWWVCSLALVLCGGSLHAERQPLAPFLGGRFPSSRPAPGVELREAFPGLSFDSPMGLIELPEGGRFLVFTKSGVIYAVEPSSGSFEKRVVLDLSAHTASTHDDGLMDVELHPDFGMEGSPGERRFFVYYQHTAANDGAAGDHRYRRTTTSRLSRFEMKEGLLEADPESEVILIDQPDPWSIHNGGAMFFHPEDHFLYLTVGDGGAPPDAAENIGQVLTGNLLGGVLRLDVDSNPARSHPLRRQPREGFTANYQIPNDNPFLDESGGLLEEFYALGLRSPHAMTVDKPTGRIWMGDVGSSEWEEINLIVRAGNYGWPAHEGSRHHAIPLPASPHGALMGPHFSYNRHAGPTGDSGDACVIVGHVYRGNALSGHLAGQLIFGDNTSGRIWSMGAEPGSQDDVKLIGQVDGGGLGGLANFSVDRSGEVYCMQLGSPGRIWKLVPSAQPEFEFPGRLSEAGVFSDLSSLEPVPGIIPYEVNQPFWSDGAVKRRWMGIPNDGPPFDAVEMARATNVGSWFFPPGTVFVKHFDMPVELPDAPALRRLETRLLFIGEDSHAYGMTYRWLDDESDAVLVDAAQHADIPVTPGVSRTWTFPGSSDCLQCHNPRAGEVLGLNTAQLNRVVAGTAVGQIEQWESDMLCSFGGHRGDASNWPRHPQVTDLTVPLTDRVKTYLDVNCAFCHRPGGRGISFDARLETPALLQQLIGWPAHSRHAARKPFLVDPGAPHQSELLSRLLATDATRMPPLGRNHVDAQAVDMVRAWLTALEPGREIPGLTATYHADMQFKTPIGVRLESSVDHDWGMSPPFEGVPSDRFSVRWSATFAAPVTGSYQITSASDDGIRISLDGRWIIHNWTDHALTVDTAVVDLEAGRAHELVVEYYENAGQAVCRVECRLGGAGPNLFSSEHLKTSSSFVQLTTRPVLGLSTIENGDILLKLRPEGRQIRLESSTDLFHWIPVDVLPDDNLLLIPRPEGTGIFYRLVH